LNCHWFTLLLLGQTRLTLMGLLVLVLLLSVLPPPSLLQPLELRRLR
jgi:hypothetical protein